MASNTRFQKKINLNQEDLLKYEIFSRIDADLNADFYKNINDFATLSPNRERVIFFHNKKNIKILCKCKMCGALKEVKLISVLMQQSGNHDTMTSCKKCVSKPLINYTQLHKEEILNLYTQQFLSLKTIAKKIPGLSYGKIRDIIVQSIGLPLYARISKKVKIRSANEAGKKLSQSKKASKKEAKHWRYNVSDSTYPADFYIKRKVLIGMHTMCILCTSKEGLELHHIDHDKENNDWDNLVPLCQRHYNQYHALSDSANGFYMGIDPGSNEAGWAIVNYKVDERDSAAESLIACGTVKSDANMDMQSKQSYVIDYLQKIASIYNIDWIVIEKPQMRGKAGVVMNMLLGKLELTFKNHKIYWINPMTMKREFGIEKEDIRLSVEDFFGISLPDDVDENASDAIGIALCSPYDEVFLDDILVNGSKIMTEKKKRQKI